MRYFSCFSWIWWFELWITKAYDTILVCNKDNCDIIGAWKEYAQNVTEKKNSQSFIPNHQILEDAKSVQEKMHGLEEKTTLRNTELQGENGMQETQKKENKSPQTRTESEDKNSSICMEENVNVAEKKLSNSLPLSIYWGMGMKREENIEQDICISSLSKSIDQIDTKSSATTAIMQEGDTDNAPMCVWFSEIDKYAIQIYEKQFPSHRNFWDITKIDTATLPDFDCLVWGFPCQAFSIAMISW
jgi:site-specific DNA-cytosine methylase